MDDKLNPHVLCKEIPDINFHLWRDLSSPESSKREYPEKEETYKKLPVKTPKPENKPREIAQIPRNLEEAFAVKPPKASPVRERKVSQKNFENNQEEIDEEPQEEKEEKPLKKPKQKTTPSKTTTTTSKPKIKPFRFVRILNFKSKSDS